MPEDAQRISERLHYALVTLTRDKAADIRRNVVEKESGLEGWRALGWARYQWAAQPTGGLGLLLRRRCYLYLNQVAEPAMLQD